VFDRVDIVRDVRLRGLSSTWSAAALTAWNLSREGCIHVVWGRASPWASLAVLPPVRRKEIAVLGVILKQFENPDEVRLFDKGKFEIVHIGGMTIGRASYEPGWKWSQHVAPIAGAPRCVIEHVGMVVSGRAMAAFDDGTEIEMVPGHLFYIPPIPHDSWVIGEEPYVSLHFLGADSYTK
jgi:hypothetical protein